MKVIWFRLAIQDLASAREFILQDNPKAASALVERIRVAVALLTEQPGLGRPGRVPGTRELIVDKTPYLLPYRVRDEKIEILRVLHCARQWPDTF